MGEPGAVGASGGRAVSSAAHAGGPTADGSARRSGPAREFFAGARVLLRGFGMWRRRPGLMLFGMLPALIVVAVLTVAVVLLIANAEAIARAVTPFADGWEQNPALLIRGVVAAALVVAVFVVALYSVTALTLIVGDPFYERIWRATEEELGDFAEAPSGFWRSAGDAALLVVKSALFGIITVVVGLIPAVGGVIAAVLAAILGGHILARELTSRPFQGRGLDRAARAAALRGNRARELGFGVAAQLFFLVPGGAILVMPAAAVGATHLARGMLAAPAPAIRSSPVPSAASPEVPPDPAPDLRRGGGSHDG